MHRFRNRIAYIWIRKLWIFANIDGLFYPVAIYTGEQRLYEYETHLILY